MKLTNVPSVTVTIKSYPSVTVMMKSYPEHDLENNGEKGVTTEINKQLQCDIRD
jgi:hypothetical protein